MHLTKTHINYSHTDITPPQYINFIFEKIMGLYKNFENKIEGTLFWIIRGRSFVFEFSLY